MFKVLRWKFIINISLYILAIVTDWIKNLFFTECYKDWVWYLGLTIPFDVFLLKFSHIKLLIIPLLLNYNYIYTQFTSIYEKKLNKLEDYLSKIDKSLSAEYVASFFLLSGFVDLEGLWFINSFDNIFTT